MGELANEGLGVPASEGWFPAVFPGTAAVTVAGAIANDIHGKNHMSQGSFCHHVEALTLLRSDGSYVVCSERENPELFRATLGGLGLTGIIVSAALRMRPVPGPLLLSEDLRCSSLAEAFALLLEAPNEWEYRFAWFDPFDPAGRGLFTRSRHVPGEVGEAEPNSLLMRTISRLPLPSAIGRAALWRGWYAFLLSKAPARRRRRMTYLDVLAPLGQFARWNRLLGPRGLLHLQSVLPTCNALALLQQMLADCRNAGEMPWIASVKVFGTRRPAGLLSFPREGVTVALDFSNHGETTRRLLQRLEGRVVEAGGAIYPGKDSTLTAAGFRRCFRSWEAFSAHVDPRFSSSFWRRVSGGAA
jgi:FAD/FMN-containing dehydrogenase